MKIAIICYNHFDATISLGKYLKRVDESVEVQFIFLLSQTFLNVEIVTLKGKNIGNGFVNNKQLAESIDQEIFDYLKGDNIGIEAFVFNSYKLGDRENIKLLSQLKKEILRRKYDVLHFVGNNPWVILLNYAFKKTPKIHTLHEPYPFEKKSYYRLLRHNLKMKLLIRSNSHIIVPSEISFNRFKTYFQFKPGQVSIIPFGPMEIFKEYSKDIIPKASDVVLYYGYISPYKGIDTLVAAIRIVLKSNPNIKFIIAGQGQFNYDVSGLPDLQLINRRLSNKEIADLNQLATIIACPYSSASQSGVVMTSFAFNNPIIATNVGALPEFIENGVTGVIIEPDNPEMLAQTIIDLFKNPTTIDIMRNNVISKYTNSAKSWLNIAKQTYRLYVEHISGKKTTDKLETLAQ
jgi:glycosyltransferase involved in cell wall biosynthesis